MTERNNFDLLRFDFSFSAYAAKRVWPAAQLPRPAEKPFLRRSSHHVRAEVARA